MKRHHEFQATGLDLEQVELFHTFADSRAADLLTNSYAMIGINDFVTNVEITVGRDHEGTPTNTKRKRNSTLSFYPKPGHKGNLEAAARGLRVDPPDFRPRIKLKANDIGRLTFNDR